MKKFPHSIIIAGVVKNCAKYLPKLFERIEGISERFEKSSCLFVENDSKDATRQLLGDWLEKGKRGTLIVYDRLDAAIPQGTARIAFARNRLLDHIEGDALLSQYDYLLSIDMDEVNHELFPEAIASCFEHPTDSWDALFANQSEIYYDIWALRHAWWSPDDCWNNVQRRPAFIPRQQASRYSVHGRMLCISPHMGLIPVDSAFGGAGIYRLEKIRGCRYRGMTKSKKAVCEHVYFHEQLRKKGAKLFINAQMMNSSGINSHSKWAWRILYRKPLIIRAKSFLKSVWSGIIRQFIGKIYGIKPNHIIPITPERNIRPPIQ